MKGINKAIIVGTLGDDPTIRYTQDGKCCANLSVATNESWKDKNTGEQKETTEWHRCTLWGKLGEIAGEYLRKGSQVYLEGKLQTRKWQDKEGHDRYTTEINVFNMQMLGGKGESKPQDQNIDQAAAGTSSGVPFDDDIPFAPFKGF